jgi:hypothetical protein
MANIFMMNEEIARGMVCFFHQKKHFYLIFKCPKYSKRMAADVNYLETIATTTEFTNTMPSLEHFFKVEKNIIPFQNEKGYSRRCKSRSFDWLLV